MESAGTPASGPLPAGEIELSVLVATRDRRELLLRCLTALAEQTQDPAGFEVIVADDGSRDGSAEAAEGFDAPFDLRVLRLGGGGKYRAVNTALGEARGSACLILDDDVVASPRLIEAHAEAHRAEPRTLGIGALTQVPPPGRDWCARAFARAWNEHYEDFRKREADWADCYGANFSAPTATLREIGGFATELSLGGDLEIGLRLQQAGAVPRYLPDAHGFHRDDKPSARMLDDVRRQGVANLALAARHPAHAGRFLDWRRGAGPRELRLRRLLIALRVPPRLVAAPGAILPGEGRKMIWFHFVTRFAFWRSVRRRVGRDEWRRLTGTGRGRRSAGRPASEGR